MLGRERERAGVGRGVEPELLDPGELAAADDLARDRVELTDVLVPKPEQPDAAVDRAGDDFGPAEIGKVETRVEARRAQDLRDACTRRREFVVGLEVHASSLAELRHGARVRPFARSHRGTR